MKEEKYNVVLTNVHLASISSAGILLAEIGSEELIKMTGMSEDDIFKILIYLTDFRYCALKHMGADAGMELDGPVLKEFEEHRELMKNLFAANNSSQASIEKIDYVS